MNGMCVAPAMCTGTGFRTCGGSCPNTNTDINNCGNCGNVCAHDEVCAAGMCQMYVIDAACTTCPCTACGGATTCCPSPGGGTYHACVDGMTCP
jgi:hypothetical protein